MPVHAMNYPDKPNSVVRTNCSIKARHPTGSSLTPMCPGGFSVL